jgi:hypothetical protein
MMNRSAKNRMMCFFVVLLSIGFLGFAQEPTATSVAGGSGGTSFSDSNISPGTRIIEVQIFSGKVLDAIQITYQLQDGRTMTGARHGGSGGQAAVFRLDSDEYITGISGRYGQYLDSLSIQTNKRTSPVYGGSGGTQSYRIDVPYRNQAIGFIGRSGQYVDAMGLLYSPISWLQTTQANQSTIFGGRGGSAFTDQDFQQGARISAIRIRAAGRIDGIQAVYTLQDGRVIEGQFHGGRGGRENVFTLDSDEYVTGIYGRYGEEVDSIAIRTNKRTSQMFGGSGGKKDYRLDAPSGNMAIGFMGRSGERLDAIGLVFGNISLRSTFRDILRRIPSRNR